MDLLMDWLFGREHRTEAATGLASPKLLRQRETPPAVPEAFDVDWWRRGRRFAQPVTRPTDFSHADATSLRSFLLTETS